MSKTFTVFIAFTVEADTPEEAKISVTSNLEAAMDADWHYSDTMRYEFDRIEPET